MQLQELKRLVEYEAVGSLVATEVEGGWILIVKKKEGIQNVDDGDNLLDLARGGTRMFKTLDALSKLVKSDLYCSPFTVC